MHTIICGNPNDGNGKISINEIEDKPAAAIFITR